MRAVIQRVKKASVTVEGICAGEIERGLLVLLGIAKDDTEKETDWMVEKIANLRIFEREDGKFDESLLDVGGALLVVSQFTLYGDCSKGRRPSFSSAMDSGKARSVFEAFVERSKRRVERRRNGCVPGAYGCYARKRRSRNDRHRFTGAVLTHVFSVGRLDS